MQTSFIQIFRSAVLASAAAFSFSAFAAGVEHPIGVGDKSFTVKLDHGQRTDRQAVVAETRAAADDGSLKLMQRSIPLPQKSSAEPKTRAEVRFEAARSMQRGEIQVGDY